MKGFSLIEVLVSTFIILLAVLLIGRALIFSLSMLKDSRERFSLQTLYSNYNNKLNSLPFDSIELSAGEYSHKHSCLTVKWKILDLSYSLKKISLRVFDKKREKTGYFYHSLLLKRRKK
jgi:prepilin-type N-terminal cleavage/methylation domain-containing protein